jgi:putative transferase (TIGR04331 family)
MRGVGQFWARMKREKWDPNGVALLVTVTMPRFVTDLRSMALGEQMLDYFDDQFNFYRALEYKIKAKTIVRLMRPDLGWRQQERWSKEFPDVLLDDGSTDILGLMNKCRVFIGTYNATTFNETLGANIPTVVYFNPAVWQYADWVKSDIAKLESVGIYHRTSESAARHLNLIWNDVKGWWSREEVQRARMEYCRLYALRDESVIIRVAGVLNEASNEQQFINN